MALRFDEFSDAWRLAAKQLQSLEAVRERLARTLLLSWPDGADAAQLLARLEALLRACARRPVRGAAALSVPRGQRHTELLGAEWKVRPTRELLEQLERPARARMLRWLQPARRWLGAATALATVRAAQSLRSPSTGPYASASARTNKVAR